MGLTENTFGDAFWEKEGVDLPQRLPEKTCMETVVLKPNVRWSLGGSTGQEEFQSMSVFL